jgi:hypothetical protein
MATWDDVRRIALALPEAVEPRSRDGLAQWRVRDKLFAWERPLRRSDMQALGRRAPKGPILAARVPHLGPKRRCWPPTRMCTSRHRTLMVTQRS